MVVSNPPYIPLEAWESVAPEARDHEPATALWSGTDGLSAIRAVERRAALLLRSGGVVGVEHADVQGESAPAVFARSGPVDRRTRPPGPGRSGTLRDRQAGTMTSVPVEEPEELAEEQDAGVESSDGLVTGASAPSSTNGDASAPSSTDGADADEPEDDEPAGARRLHTDGDEAREEAISSASVAVQRGELVVLPTDTVYGIGADAFDATAVQALLDAKGRGRDMPPPVLISAATTLDALATGVPEYARKLIDQFWPGPLTIVCNQQRSLQWDLGETRGTVAVRMPDHRLALELLERTGPMAVSSANVTGHPAATDADQAEEMLGDSVAVIIDDGPSPGGAASTIVDVRGDHGRLLRSGALSLEELNDALDDMDARILGEDEEPEAGA